MTGINKCSSMKTNQIYYIILNMMFICQLWADGEPEKTGPELDILTVLAQQPLEKTWVKMVVVKPDWKLLQGDRSKLSYYLKLNDKFYLNHTSMVSNTRYFANYTVHFPVRHILYIPRLPSSEMIKSCKSKEDFFSLLGVNHSHNSAGGHLPKDRVSIWRFIGWQDDGIHFLSIMHDSESNSSVYCIEPITLHDKK